MEALAIISVRLSYASRLSLSTRVITLAWARFTLVERASSIERFDNYDGVCTSGRRHVLRVIVRAGIT